MAQWVKAHGYPLIDLVIVLCFQKKSTSTLVELQICTNVLKGNLVIAIKVLNTQNLEIQFFFYESIL